MEEQNIPFKNRLEIEKLSTAVEQLKTQLGRVISGQSDVIDLLLVGLLCDGHVLLEGVPGVAKTMLSKLMAKSLDISFRRLQFTPDLMPSDVLGTSVFNPKSVQSRNSFHLKQDLLPKSRFPVSLSFPDREDGSDPF
ncbi:MAG: AAA family ATPase, partial [Spirosomataceae bacterium]